MKSQCGQAKLLRQIPIRVHLRALYALKVFTLNKRLNTLLDHVDLRFELPNELAERL